MSGALSAEVRQLELEQRRYKQLQRRGAATLTTRTFEIAATTVSEGETLKYWFSGANANTLVVSLIVHDHPQAAVRKFYDPDKDRLGICYHNYLAGLTNAFSGTFVTNQEVSIEQES